MSSDTDESRRRFVNGVGGPASGHATTPATAQQGSHTTAANDAGVRRAKTRRPPAVSPRPNGEPPRKKR